MGQVWVIFTDSGQVVKRLRPALVISGLDSEFVITRFESLEAGTASDLIKSSPGQLWIKVGQVWFDKK